MLTQSELKSKLHYDINTGIFTHLTTCNGATKVGQVAGCLFGIEGYIRLTLNGKAYLAHRLAWLYVYGTFPKNQIDHINRIEDDNRICNLREANNSENQCNSSIYKNNKLNIRGVYYHHCAKKFRASIQKNKIRYYEDFTNLQDAIDYRAQMVINLHSNFAPALALA